jgi:hypothetical protein
VDIKLKEIDSLQQKKQAQVVDELIVAVATVDPKLHINIQKRRG